MKPEDPLLHSHMVIFWAILIQSTTLFPYWKYIFNIVVLSIPSSSEWPLRFMFSTKTPYIPPPFPLRSTCLFHVILLHLTIGYYLLNSRDRTVPYYAVSCVTLLPSSYQTQLSWSQPTIRHPQTMFLPRRANIIFSQILNDSHNCISVYFNTYDWPNGSFSKYIISCVSIKFPWVMNDVYISEYLCILLNTCF